jgi:hypothetical protein
LTGPVPFPNWTSRGSGGTAPGGSPRVAHLIRLEIDVKGGYVTILECRPPWLPDMGPEWTRFPIARLRFTASRGEWTLYWRDRNLAFHRSTRIGPSSDVAALLAEIEADPTRIFWG